MKQVNKELPSAPNTPEENATVSRQEFENLQRKYELRLEALEQENALLRSKLYGRKSEKQVQGIDDGQLSLFDIPPCEPEAEPEKTDDSIEVKSHERKKRGRKPLPASLPRVELVFTIPKEERTCACGEVKACCGKEISEELEYIPARIRVIQIIREKYACKSCEGTAEEDKPAVIIAPRPKKMIPKGIATPGLLAHILVAKFEDALPFYRQERQFSRLGIELSRQNMSNWAMKVAEKCHKLLENLVLHIRSGPIINMDETRFQVLNEPDRAATAKSFMWCMRGGPPDLPAVLFKYSPSRAGAVASELLADYSGCVQTDDFSGYNFLNKQELIVHLTCMAHLRRMFVDVQKALDATKKKNKKPISNTGKILRMIRRLYMFERKFTQDGLTGSDKLKARMERARPVFEKLKKLISDLCPLAPPEGLFGKALSYAQKNLPLIEHYFDHSCAGLDNTAVENAIRPFAVGRRNWLFGGNVAGAEASATLYSLIQTARLNGLDPYNYLRYIFEKLPYAETDKDHQMLLPFNLSKEDIAISG